jgi:hypothetical protein
MQTMKSVGHKPLKSEQNRFAPLIFIVVVAAIAFIAIKMINWGDIQLRAEGDMYEIIVFADSSDYARLQPALENTFGRELITPQPEPLFTLVHEPIHRITDYRRHKNILIVAPLDGSGPAAEYMNNILSEGVRQVIANGEEFVINRYNSNASGQIMMFLTAPTLHDIYENVRRESDRLFYYFSNFSLQREIQTITSERRYAKRELSERFSKEYDWTLYVQNDYFLAKEDGDERFVWLRRQTPTDMERWIFIHWIENTSPDRLHDAFVQNTRDSLTRQFMRTLDEKASVQIAPEYYESEVINFKDRYAIKTRGLWRFSDYSGGGPFINYTLYDPESQRIYMIDGSIFAPRYEKKKLILQVQALLNTFEPSPNTMATVEPNQVTYSP